MIRRPVLLGFLLVTLLAAAAFGQEKWLLTTAQFKTESVLLKGLDSSGVKVVPASGGGERTVAMGDFLDLTRSAPALQPSGRYILHLSGGDQLSGEPVALRGDSLVWKSPDVGEITIPGSRMVAITAPGKPAPAERQHEDVVRLVNGDTVRGIIAAMGGDKVTVQVTGGGNSEVPMSSIAAINFAATPGSSPAQHGFRVRFDDASSLVGTDAKLDGNNLVLTLGKNAGRKLPLTHITAIEQVNGPVSWLSSRLPAEAVYYRFIGGPQQPAAYMDRSWGGQRGIDFKGRIFAHGIAVHAFSRLTWPLDGQYEAFRTRYAIESDAGGLADATVRVRLDDKIVYEKGHVRSGRLSPVVLLDLKGAKKLTLEVDGGTAYAQDTLDWIEPALLKHKPAEPPGPEPDDSDAATQPSTAPASQPSASADRAASSNALTVTHMGVFPQIDINVDVQGGTLSPAVAKAILKALPATKPDANRDPPAEKN
jgi:hypothetical protein